MTTTARNTVRRPISVGRRCLGAAVIASSMSILAAVTLPGELAATFGSLAALITFIGVGIPLAISDAKNSRLPDALTLPLASALVCILTISSIASGDPFRTLWAGIIALAAATVFFLIGLAGGMGFGDVKLMLSIGLLLGWYSWQVTLGGILLAFILAAPIVIVRLIRRTRNPDLSNHFPLGPPLIVAAIIAALAAFADGPM